MKREELLSVLGFVKEALLTQDIIPIYSHFCFDGHGVIAYDDIVALEFPMETDFKCCLPGLPLYRYLNALSSKEVLVSKAEGDIVRVKGGRSNIKFNYLPLSSFIFKFPKTSRKDTIIKLDADFFKGLDLCSGFTLSDPTYLYTTGVSLCQDPDEGLLLFSTDLSTLTRYDLSTSCSRDLGEVKIFPAKFCKILNTLSKSFKAEEMVVSDEYSVVTFEGGITVFTKLIYLLGSPDFMGVFEDRCGDLEGYLDKVPEAMVSMLSRAEVIFGTNVYEKNLRLSINEEGITFSAESTYGSFKELIKLDSSDINFPDCILSLGLLSRILLKAESFALLENNAVFMFGSEDEFTHLVSYVEEGD